MRVQFYKVVALMACACLTACSDAPSGAGPTGSPTTPGGGGGGGTGGSVAAVTISSINGNTVSSASLRGITASGTNYTFNSNTNSISISGTCIATALVVMIGDASGYTTCSANNTYSMSANKTTNGTYNFSIYQGFSSSRYSNSVVLQWNRGTILLSNLTLGSQSATTNTNSVTLGGNCDSGAVVNLMYPSSTPLSSASCTVGVYSFTVSQSTDGTYNYTVQEMDSVGNVSQPLTFQWIRMTSAPAVTIVTPTALSSTSPSSPMTAQTGFTATLGCLAGGQHVTVNNVTDGTTNNYTCVSATSTVDIPVSAANNAPTVTHYSVTQVDAAGNTSPALDFYWEQVPNAPATPSLVTAATAYVNTIPSVGSPYNIQVNCDSTLPAVVHLTGSTGSVMTDPTLTCSSSPITIPVHEAAAGSYTYTIWQSFTGLNSGSINMNLIVDTHTPNAPAITLPSGNPYYSNQGSLSLTVTCEAGATVYLTGAATAQTSCDSTKLTASFSDTKTVGSYNYSIYQTDLALKSSASTSFTWNYSVTQPGAVTVTSHTSPYSSNTTSVTIAGACATNDTVTISGGYNSSAVCSGGAYSFTSTPSSDGVYNYSLSQTDLYGNTSTSTSFTWTRDTSTPPAPTITSPASSPYTSSGVVNNVYVGLTLVGTCVNGTLVNLSRSGFATSASCSSGSFALTDTPGSDGTYNYTVTQTTLNGAGNTSAAATFQWIRNSTPAPPVITSPTTNPYYSNGPNSANGSSLTIAGNCTAGYTVSLSGASSSSMTCTPSGTFSFPVSESTAGTYSFNLVQMSVTQVSSASATVTWTVITATPSTPTIATPAVNPYYSNGSTFNVTGTCTTGDTVNVTGSLTGSASCSSSGTYSVTVSASVDNTYSLLVSQTDIAGNVSASVAQTWVRDTVPPAAPTIIHPSTSPYTSADTNLIFNGGCAVGATVTMSGSGTGSAVCTSSGGFSITTSETTDGTYNYSFSQTDLAGNVSALTTFQWVRDTTIPATPMMIVPVTDPYYSNGSSLSITATCTYGVTPLPDQVTLTDQAGNVLGGPTNCPSSGQVNFTVNESVDGTYTFYTEQLNQNTQLTSAQDSQVWVRSTVIPPIPTITSPSTQAYTGPGNLTIIGNCASGDTVNLTGASTQSLTCPTTNSYSFTVVESVDGTYNFSVTQTDIYGNVSNPATLSWTRNNNSIPAPQITSPTTNPLNNNLSTLTISGTCTAGYLVSMSGVTAGAVTSPAGSLAQTCTSSGTFSYVISETSDGTYSLSFIQTYNSASSSASTFTWNRSTVLPVVTLSGPPNPNVSTSASFTFSSSETGSTFQCALDNSAYNICVSPNTITGLPQDGSSHTYYVRALDIYGNIGNAASVTWTQAAVTYKTMALYHFDSSPGATVDSSLWGTKNTLTPGGTPVSLTSGKFNQGETLGTGNYFTAANATSLNLGPQTMTVEGWYKLTTALPSTVNSYFTLASKNGTSGNYGWELRITRAPSGSCYFTFVGSADGVNTVSINSNTSSSICGSSNNFYYFFFSFNSGKVTFIRSTSSFRNLTPTSSTMSITSLHSSTAPLSIGANSTSSTTPGGSLWFTGAIDEFRISDVVRTTPTSAPTAAFTAD